MVWSPASRATVSKLIRDYIILRRKWSRQEMYKQTRGFWLCQHSVESFGGNGCSPSTPVKKLVASFVLQLLDGQWTLAPLFPKLTQWGPRSLGNTLYHNKKIYQIWKWVIATFILKFYVLCRIIYSTFILLESRFFFHAHITWYHCSVLGISSASL